mmetsp:Transcript_42300/g.106728  ORF Transcript_42300/g.106728 Transcript_42300/m.106728 type:complete len:1156 (-) Transcript_42300:1205-4672(-)
MMGSNLTRDSESLFLGTTNQHDLLTKTDVSDMHRPTRIECSHQQCGSHLFSFGVHHERAVGGPMSKVLHPHSDVVQAQRGEGLVEVHLERNRAAGQCRDLCGVGGAGAHVQPVVTAGLGACALLHGREGGLVDGGRAYVGHGAHHGEAAGQRSRRAGVPVLLVLSARLAQVHVHIDEAGQTHSAAGATQIALRDGHRLRHLAHALHQQFGTLHVGDQRHTVVDGHATGGVAAREDRGRAQRAVARRQDHRQIDGVVAQVALQRPLVQLGLRPLDHAHRHLVFDQIVGGAGRGQQLVAELGGQFGGVRQKLGLLAVGTQREQHRLARQTKAAGQHRLEVGLAVGAAKAGHLTGAGHLDAGHRIGAAQAAKAELGRLHAHAVRHRLQRLQRLQGGIVQNGARGQADKIRVQRLADEGKAAAGAHVALDHLDAVVLGDELDVHRAADVQLARDRTRGLHHTLQSGLVDVARRQHQRGVARVHASVLHVLADRVADELTLRGHRVHVDLLGVLDELADHHHVVRRDRGGAVQELLQLLVRVHHVHAGAAQHKAGPHQARVAHLVAEAQRLLEVHAVAPARLVHAQQVEQTREVEAVLGVLDHGRQSAQHGDLVARQAHHQVVGDLSAHRDDHAAAALLVEDVRHTLHAQLLKVEAIALVVVGAHRLRVVVDHDGAMAHLAQLLYAAHRAVVELHRAADAVGAAAQHDHGAALLVGDIVLRGAVGHVQVIVGGRELGGHRVDLLHEGQHAVLVTQIAHHALGALHLARHLAIREAGALHLGQQRRRESAQAAGQVTQTRLQLADVLQAVQEPAIDTRELVHALHRVAVAQRLRQHRHAHRGGYAQPLVAHLAAEAALEAVQATGAHHAQRLLDRLLEGAADRHHFAHALHAGADHLVDALELVHVPARHLHHHVVQRRLPAGGGHLRDRVAQLGQRLAQRQLGRHKGQRIAGRLAGQRTAAREPRVHLDDKVLLRAGVERELDVALTHDAQMSRYLDAHLAQHVVLGVGERLAGCHHDRLAGVHAQRIKVLHVAHCDAVVVGVANHLVLDLLPAFHRSLDQNLRCCGERLGGQRLEFLFILDDATTKTTKCESRTDHNWITDCGGSNLCIFHRVHSCTASDSDTDLFELASKQITILRVQNGFDWCSENIHTVVLQNTYI